MARMTLDCRSVPSESNCSLTITGEPEEVLRTAAAHAVGAHGHTDDDELREGLRAAMTPAVTLEVEPGAFVQVIEFRTSRIEEFADVEQQWLEAIGDDRTTRWEMTCADRSDPQRYMQMVGFRDAVSAQDNSKHPATTRFAEVFRGLCDADPVFHDLDVVNVTPE